MEKYYIKSKDWKKIYEFLKTRQDVRVGNEDKTRTFGEAVYFIMRTGAQWRELPVYYGKWRSIHKRFGNGPIKDCGTKPLFILQKGMTGNQ